MAEGTSSGVSVWKTQRAGGEEEEEEEEEAPAPAAAGAAADDEKGVVVDADADADADVPTRRKEEASARCISHFVELNAVKDRRLFGQGKTLLAEVRGCVRPATFVLVLSA